MRGCSGSCGGGGKSSASGVPLPASGGSLPAAGLRLPAASVRRLPPTARFSPPPVPCRPRMSPFPQRAIRCRPRASDYRRAALAVGRGPLAAGREPPAAGSGRPDAGSPPPESGLQRAAVTLEASANSSRAPPRDCEPGAEPRGPKGAGKSPLWTLGGPYPAGQHPAEDHDFGLPRFHPGPSQVPKSEPAGVRPRTWVTLQTGDMGNTPAGEWLIVPAGR